MKKGPCRKKVYVVTLHVLKSWIIGACTAIAAVWCTSYSVGMVGRNVTVGEGRAELCTGDIAWVHW